MVAAFASEYHLATLVGVTTAGGRLVATSAFKVGAVIALALADVLLGIEVLTPRDWLITIAKGGAPASRRLRRRAQVLHCTR